MKFDWILLLPLLAFTNSIPALNCRSLNKLRKSLDRLSSLNKSQASRLVNDSTQRCEGLPDARRLFDDLLRKSGYAQSVRPVRRAADNITVEVGVALAEIEDLEERAGRLSYRVLFRFLWNDYQLMWDPLEYGGIQEIDVNAKDIWTPDIDLYNNVKSEINKDIKARVYSSGYVLWMPSAHYKSSCSHEFRSDSWHCPMLFRSWVHVGTELDIQPYQGMNDMDLRELMHSPHWIVLQTKGERVVKSFPCCGDLPFPAMEYLLKVRNKIGHPALLGKRSIRDLEF